MKVNSRLSLALMISLFSILYLVTSISAQDGQFVDPDCPPGSPPGTVCDPHTAGGPEGHHPGGDFVDPDCPPGSPPGTTCVPGDNSDGHHPGGQFQDPDCPPGSPPGTTCVP